MNRIAEQMNLRIVGLLLLLELLSVYFLWTLNPVSQVGETAFALLLAIDLVAFAMISYVYRASKSGDGIGRGAMLVGCSFVLLLLFALLAL